MEIDEIKRRLKQGLERRTKRDNMELLPIVKKPHKRRTDPILSAMKRPDGARLWYKNRFLLWDTEAEAWLVYRQGDDTRLMKLLMITSDKGKAIKELMEGVRDDEKDN